MGAQVLAAGTFWSANKVRWYATFRQCQPAARDQSIFCNDSMNGPDIEKATGSEGQQVPRGKAEQEGLRGPTWLGWGTGTEEAGCTE